MMLEGWCLLSLLQDFILSLRLGLVSQELNFYFQSNKKGRTVTSVI
jgi:hypothetical protein